MWCHNKWDLFCFFVFLFFRGAGGGVYFSWQSTKYKVDKAVSETKLDTSV